MPSHALKDALARLEAEFEAALRQRVALQESDHSDPGAHRLARIEREPAIRQAIDQSCLEWIRTRSWPRCDAECAAFFWDRIMEARTVAHWLLARRTRFPGVGPAEVLELLLVDYWTFAGHH